MPVTKWNDLLPLMAQRLPGAADDVMVQALRDAWRAFCTRSEWWRVAIDLDLVSGQTSYELNIPKDAHIRKIAFVGLRQQDDIDNHLDGAYLPEAAWRFQQDDSSGRYLISILWTPDTDATGALRVKPVLVPTLQTREPPTQDVFERWGDTLVAKAIAELCRQRGKPYSSQLSAVDAELEFMRGVNRARRMNIVGYSATAQTFRPQKYRPVNTGDSLMPWGAPK